MGQSKSSSRSVKLTEKLVLSTLATKDSYVKEMPSEILSSNLVHSKDSEKLDKNNKF